MKKVVLLTSIALISANCFAQSTIQSLNKEQIKHALNNRTITTIPVVTLNKQLVNNNPVSVFFEKNGQVKGKFTTQPDKNPQTDQGKWEVKAHDTLCVTWDHWNDARPICVYVYDLKNTIVFVNEKTNKFETMTLKNDIKTGDSITS